MMPLVLILVQLLSVWSVETDGQLTCEPATGSHNSLCACSLSDGTGVVDLSAYANPDTTYRFYSSYYGHEYYYNPCFPMNYPDADKCHDNTAAGCQVDNNDLLPTSYKIGTYSDVKFTVDSIGNVVFTYTGGDDDRSMVLTLVCNPEATTPVFTALGELTSPKRYEFTLAALCACPFANPNSQCSVGGGGGSTSDNNKESNDPGVVGIIILSLTFAAVVTYFVLGAVVLRMKYQKSGTDLIINKAFWKEFPFLVKDGVVFTFSPCYRLYKDKRGYSNF